MKIYGLSVRTLLVLLVIPLIFICADSAFAGGNPPGTGEKTSGPVVTGEIVLIPLDWDDVTSDVLFSFTGKCKGEDVNVRNLIFDEATFDFVSEATLLDTRWDIDDLPDGCAPDPSAELVIREVKNFFDWDPLQIKQAEIDMIFVY